MIRHFTWFLAGLTVGTIWLTTLQYTAMLDLPSLGHDVGKDRTNINMLPPFEGRLYNMEGDWELYEVSDVRLPKTNDTSLTLEEKRWLQLQGKRRETVDVYCKTHAELQVPINRLKHKDLTPFYKTVLLGKRDRSLYCPVGKVACTSWKTALAILQGHYGGLKPGEHIHNLDVLLRNDVRPLSLTDNPASLLESHQIFLFVRHPFERLVSAFKNKFQAVNGENLQMKYGRVIMKRYRGEALSEKEKTTGWGVRFHEFIKWIVDDRVSNVHWNPFNDICHLCSTPYTFIGKMETFAEDTKYILKHMYGTENFTKFPHSNPSPKASRRSLESYFVDVPKQDVLRLIERYDIDFKMFNYTWSL